MAGNGWDRPGLVTQAWMGAARQGALGIGPAWIGKAGMAGFGMAGFGKTRQAGLSTDWRGREWLCMAGNARRHTTPCATASNMALNS